MDVREKLVEWIFGSLCRHIHKSCKLAENIADDLIAHGVTAQEWISVEERLPEKSGNYIVADKSGWVGQRHFYKSCPEAFMCVPITHWMPLPEPPKEANE